ncbi:Eco57I restriction-modification methylase domain-containing protein [Verrucomicrobiota bacterium]
MSEDLRTEIESTLKSFARAPLREASTNLLGTLGYQSEKTLDLDNSRDSFLAEFDKGDRKFLKDKALFDQWKSIDFLFQLTDDEVRTAGAQSELSFDSSTEYDGTNYTSYLFFALDLEKGHYTRTYLSDITREINRLVTMPAMILFKQGGLLTLSLINRRISKKDPEKDVLKKVTLIKDIRCDDPHRAHIEILHDLSMSELLAKHECADFKQLHEAWQKTLDTNELNKKFYREIANWYFWALDHVEFPADIEKNDATRNATSVIRLLTRLIFCWFLKEKNLVPPDLFNERKLETVLKSLKDDDSTFYRAILQNLFFATLNQKMNVGKEINRKFAEDKNFQGKRHDHGITTFYRYEEFFRDSNAALKLFEDIPFLNGGLFDCLDKEDDANKVQYVDGFTRNARKQPKVPNFLFFSDYRPLDLSDAYGDKKKKKEKVRGLINLLDSYKFTITENTPIEEEIALDPELLGKVFENLLASYNPETDTTARKHTGSFYTPREIVNSMVDESLIAYLEGQLKAKVPKLAKMKDLKDLLREVFAYTEKVHPFDKKEVEALIDAIDTCKILDPACGSGAFPMGILHKLVFILGKLDPHNERWKQKQMDKLDSVSMREELERTFENNDDDFGRKLCLIENCIYGVDIQPIAIQISKLRFFISLICDQRTNKNKAQNCGVRPLPNLETKFVAANTLISLDRGEGLLVDPRLSKLEKELASVRHKHFAAQRRRDKLTLQKRDAELREEIAAVLADGGMTGAASHQLAGWDPYDQNTNAGFFDTEWMFGVPQGFDVVIGNPPYGFRNTLSPEEKKYFRKVEGIDFPSGDIAELFVIKCLTRLVVERGCLTFIIPKKSLYGESWANVRALWLRNSLCFLIDASKAFENVLLEQVAFGMSKQMDGSAPITIGCLDPSTRSVRVFGEFQIQEVFTRDMRNAQIYRGLYPRSLMSKIRKASVDDAAICIKAEIGISNITPHLTFEAKGNHPCLKGIDLMRYGLKPDIRYLKGSVARPLMPACTHDKLIGQEIVAHIQNPTPHISIVIFFDRGGRLLNDTCVELRILDNRLDALFLMAYLQSTFVAWYAYNFVYNRAIRTMHFINYYVTQLPLPKAVIENGSRQTAISDLSRRILAAKKADPSAHTSAIEAQIDSLVYELYGLTDDEIKIVEGETQ